MVQEINPDGFANNQEVYDFLGIDPSDYVVFKTQGERYKAKKKKGKRPIPTWVKVVGGLGIAWLLMGFSD